MTHEDGKLVDNEANAEIGKTDEETFTFSVELYACAPQQYVLAGLDDRRPWQQIFKISVVCKRHARTSIRNKLIEILNKLTFSAIWLPLKICFMLSVRLSSYGCTWEVWRARKKRKSCSRR